MRMTKNIKKNERKQTKTNTNPLPSRSGTIKDSISALTNAFFCAGCTVPHARTALPLRERQRGDGETYFPYFLFSNGSDKSSGGLWREGGSPHAVHW